MEMADGEALTAVSPHVRRAGGDLETTEEVWVVEQPAAGDWTVRISGAGMVTVWQDYKQLPPTTVPEPTKPPTNMPQPTETAAPRASTTHTPISATPMPTRTPETAVIALITPEKTQRAEIPAVPQKNVWRLWLLGTLFFLFVFGTGAVWTLKIQKPRVSGALRILGGGHLPEHFIDLDSLRKTAVTLGKSPADVPLTGAEAQATIVPGKMMNETRQMQLSGSANLTLNNRRVASFAHLSDSAVINLGGGVRVRYENLRLRRATRLEGRNEKRKIRNENAVRF
ncbi:MAG: hypothetical protein GY803_12645 [Chloroflexi bacterium]|nr:hypothetical protein [Chloroflexota bacterium]